MNSLYKYAAAAALAAILAAPAAMAAKAKKPGKEHTLTGEAKCAKCALKESDTCQTVIVSEAKKGHPMTFYLEQNDVAKAFHETICKEPKKVTVTGTATKGGKGGKSMLVASKIELVK
jgi:hypothetical protein